MFDNRSMRLADAATAITSSVFDRIYVKVNIFLAKSSKIYHILAQMTAEERKHRIEAYLQEVEFASLEDLAKHVDASVSTVRRDLTVLEAAGSVKRTHGGARIVTPKSDEFTFSARDTHQLDGEGSHRPRLRGADPAEPERHHRRRHDRLSRREASRSRSRRRS